MGCGGAYYILWNRLCRSVGFSFRLFFDLVIFQLPLRTKKTPICTPKTTAAVDREAAKLAMLWFSLPRAAPVPNVLDGDVVVVDDILAFFERYGSSKDAYKSKVCWCS